MDLSFSRFDRDAEVTALPGDLAVLMIGIAVRQAESPTAIAHAKSDARFVLATFDARLLAPLDGAFNGPMANALTAWRDDRRKEE